MNIRPARAADVAHVCADLWPRAYEEAEVLGSGDPAVRYVGFFGRSGLLTWTLADTEPLVVAGVQPDDGICWTWFAAHRRFGERPMATRAVRWLTAHAAAVVAPLPVDCMSALPDAARWFRAIGFVPIYNTGLLTRYRFRVEG